MYKSSMGLYLISAVEDLFSTWIEWEHICSALQFIAFIYDDTIESGTPKKTKQCVKETHRAQLIPK